MNLFAVRCDSSIKAATKNDEIKIVRARVSKGWHI